MTTNEKGTSDNSVVVLYREIAELEKEVGFAAFPYTRATYVREKLGVDEKDADSEKLIATLWGWSCFLSRIKDLKDSGSPAWTRMCNWD